MLYTWLLNLRINAWSSNYAYKFHFIKFSPFGCTINAIHARDP